MEERVIGIMGAMPEEIDEVVQLLADRNEVTIGMRTYYTGTINNVRTVVAFSKWGMTAASATVTTMILKFNATEIIFTGVAGALHPDLRIGDIVLGRRLIQHDMNAEPLMDRYVIPLLNKTWFECGAGELSAATTAINGLLDNRHLHEIISEDEFGRFDIQQPRLFTGDIASGDKFISTGTDKQQLAAALPTVLCVEMEGMAVAHICYEYSRPFTIIRTISDTSDENSPIDFPAFINSISSKYSLQIIKNLFLQFEPSGTPARTA